MLSKAISSETRTFKTVLILVLMEYALEGHKVQGGTQRVRGVLILVLMEYALEGLCPLLLWATATRLNPCFNGICSRRAGEEHQGRNQQ